MLFVERDELVDANLVDELSGLAIADTAPRAVDLSSDGFGALRPDPRRDPERGSDVDRRERVTLPERSN